MIAVRINVSAVRSRHPTCDALPVWKKRWRRINAPHLVALVKAGVKFPNGESEMFQARKPDDCLLFSQAPSVLAASETSIHNI
jgi:hypothetical protein